MNFWGGLTSGYQCECWFTPKLEIPAPTTLVTRSNTNFCFGKPKRKTFFFANPKKKKKKKKKNGRPPKSHPLSFPVCLSIDTVKLGSFIHIWYQCRSLANPRSVCVCVCVCVFLSLSSSLRTFSWTPEASESRLLLMGCLLLLCLMSFMHAVTVQYGNL